MRVALVDFFSRAYSVESAYQEAMGGAQASVCFLAEALARQGHQVFLINHGTDLKIERGVTCIPLGESDNHSLAGLRLHAMILSQNAGFAAARLPMRRLLPATTRLVFWAHDAWDALTLQALQQSSERGAYDGFAFLSDWHRTTVRDHFQLPPDKCQVIGYGLAPQAHHLFAQAESIVAAKPMPPSLAYISAPYRGLEVLLDALPRIREAIPGTQLSVFSGMGVYLPGSEGEDRPYAPLFRRCLTQEGVVYRGPQPKALLSQALKATTLLAYPNTFPETFCLAIAEALAAGCEVVSTALGALPQTSLGLASLIPSDSDTARFRRRFEDTVIARLQAIQSSTPEAREAQLQRQVQHVRSAMDWDTQARAWIDWLTSLAEQ